MTHPRTHIISRNSKPLLPTALVYIQFSPADIENTCIYCTGIFRSCDIFGCFICKSLYCSDCINTFSEKSNKYPTWCHSTELCDHYCTLVQKDSHRYNLICSIECQSKFNQKYNNSLKSYLDFYTVEGDPTCITDFFTEPNTFIFSKTPDDVETYFNRIKTPQPCYTNPSYTQSIFNQNHHIAHQMETHYLCSDCYQMYASSYLLKCETCMTLVCYKCVIIRYIYLEAKFIHDNEWCSACETNRSLLISECYKAVHALYFVCSPVCFDKFDMTHKNSKQIVT